MRGAATAAMQIVELQPVLIQHELRLEPREDIVELVAVHLHVDRADGRAIGHHAEIAEQMLDRIVGKERHAVVTPDPAVAQKRGDPAGYLPQLAEADRSPVARRR